ncbi:hypothetical protein JJB47_12015 [Clostridium perfringens]|uniref:Lipoprotein n=1 Tax=Clostridium perfringens TaxID=1502 RepID=A0AAW4IY13_CLOPF|nr:hypothetical protein [Clostridium perfringens]
MSMVLCVLLIGCENSTKNNIQNEQVEKQEEAVIYHKRIPVKMVEIQKTWSSNKEQIWCITVKSDEYNLEKSFKQGMSAMYSNIYAGKLYRGETKEGDIIYAEFLSWKQGDKIIKRDIDNLIE